MSSPVISTKKSLTSLKLRVMRGKTVIGMLFVGFFIGVILTSVLLRLNSTEVEPVLDVMRFPIFSFTT